MLPHVLGVSVYFSFWVIAAVAACWMALSMVREAGMPSGRAAAALLVLVVVIIAGSKLYFLAGYFLFPSAESAFRTQDDVAILMRQGYRIPGGILLMGITLPVVCRLFGLPTLRFADAMMPALGIAAIFVRIGCFMNGCCYGYVTDGPWGVQFPIGSKAYETQLMLHEIVWPAEHSLPVHPLQLYYAVAGLALYLLGRRWQAAEHFEGEVWAKCFAFFFGTTFLLEFMRAHTVYINLVVPPLVAAVAVVVLVRGRQQNAVAVNAAP